MGGSVGTALPLSKDIEKAESFLYTQKDVNLFSRKCEISISFLLQSMKKNELNDFDNIHPTNSKSDFAANSVEPNQDAELLLSE